MSDILMPGKGGRRTKRKMTVNEVHNEVLELAGHMSQFARAVGGDFQRFQGLLMALMKDLDKVKVYDCEACGEKDVWVPVLESIPTESICPSCEKPLDGAKQTSLDEFSEEE